MTGVKLEDVQGAILIGLLSIDWVPGTNYAFLVYSLDDLPKEIFSAYSEVDKRPNAPRFSLLKLTYKLLGRLGSKTYDGNYSVRVR